MLQALRDKRREDGFTLIELMVVVLIIAILVAIAIPTFLGARERAQEKAAQSSVRNGLTSTKEIFTDDESFIFGANLASTLTELNRIEPSLTFVTNTVDSTDKNTISVEVSADGSEVWLAVLADNDTCFYIHDDTNAGGGTEYGEGADTACAGDDAEAYAAYAAEW